jgi:hypothetical protein
MKTLSSNGGRRGLRIDLKVLKLLKDGPKSVTEMKRAMGLDPVPPNHGFSMIMKRLVACGFAEFDRKTRRYGIVDGWKICPHCEGRLLIEDEKKPT